LQQSSAQRLEEDNLLFNGQEIATDAQGYLLDSTQWDLALAESIANIETITMTDEHW
jgi:tRNA 2-thiouridine synthesizing protein E